MIRGSPVPGVAYTRAVPSKARKRAILPSRIQKVVHGAGVWLSWGHIWKLNLTVFFEDASAAQLPLS